MKTIIVAYLFLTGLSASAYDFQCTDAVGVMKGHVDEFSLILDYATFSEEVAIPSLEVTAPHQIDLSYVNAATLHANQVKMTDPLVFLSERFTKHSLDIRDYTGTVKFNEDFVGMQNHEVQSSLLKTTEGTRVIIDLRSFNTESPGPVFEQVHLKWNFDLNNCTIE